MTPLRAAALLLLALAAGVAAAATPTDSLYRIEAPLTDQDGRAARLDLHSGRATLVAMFYGSCPHVCPMLVSSMQRMESGLDAPARARLRVLMLSLDPERDTPDRLREVAQRHRADLARWTFARTPDADVRRIAAALGVQYRRLPDGEISHSTIVTLLDAEGRLVASTSQPLRPEPEFLRALHTHTAPERTTPP